ncbi:MAG: hypothetical protein Q4F31_00415 [Eubacteriales bacterium]|nr:hypothetical protein [Eubacteriales bacterium]
MSDFCNMTFEVAAVEIEVLNEELREAEELSDGLNTQIAYLKERNRLLENRLRSYGIDYDDIEDLLAAM